MHRFLAPLLAVALSSCGSPDAHGPEAEFSFTKDRDRWRATAVSARVERLTDPERGDEWSIRLTARRDPEGEQLTLFAVAPTVAGNHPVQAFGAFLGFAARPSVPIPVTNVCGSGSLDDETGEMASGTLIIESWSDGEQTLSGNFRVNVCDVQEPADAKTLAEGVFRDVPVQGDGRRE
ncbi:MAG: hypothetical protein MPN21_23405 [Thermoanaerobaculia bacterium]|nr:hypothetical protein [Thermoanaerobaculia bacterium]